MIYIQSYIRYILTLMLYFWLVMQALINSQAISLMQQDMILINVARGSLIDEDALLANANKFLYIGLDTIKDKSINGLMKFVEFENIIITPHIAYLIDSTVKTIWEETYKYI